MKKNYNTPECEFQALSNADCIMLSVGTQYNNSGDDLELWEN